MNAVKIDGSKGKWPARLDGIVVEFPTIPEGASLEDAMEFLEARSENEDAAVAFVRDAIESQQDKDLSSDLKRKAREDGKTYTRDEVKALPQRSEVVTEDEVKAFGTDWKIAPPRVGTTSKLKAAEAKARRLEEQQEAANAEIVEMLRDLPKAKQETRVASLIAAGILPEGFTL